jgi:hypothetical protein
MNLIPIKLRTPIVEFRAALARNGLRTQEDYDELVYASEDCSVRVNLSRLGEGQLVRCFISVDEQRLLSTGLELFTAMSLEGHPVVAYGAGCGQMTFEFEWLHPDGADWKISGQRLDVFMQLLRCSLGPKPRPARGARYRSMARESLEGVLAHMMPA